MSANTPPLRQIPLTELPHLPLPTLKIQTDDDVGFWKTTRSFNDYRIFLRRLNESVVGCFLPWEPSRRSQVRSYGRPSYPITNPGSQWKGSLHF